MKLSSKWKGTVEVASTQFVRVIKAKRDEREIVCVCVSECVCVCERERERESVCVCLHIKYVVNGLFGFSWK